MFSKVTREQHLERMKEEQLDVLVIGGGITGAGIVLDAVTRGLNVGLVEMRDFASGTSSRSTKLVHGGLRYLAQFDVKTVAEVGKEREIVYQNAPHVTTPVKMMLPFYKGGTFGSLTTGIGLDIYDRLAQVKKAERKFMLDSEDALKREPILQKNNLAGAGVYVEYRTDDSRLTLEVIKKANDLGASLANYVKVVKLLYRQDTNQLIGVRVFDEINKEEFTIHAKRIINAAGPWVDNLRELDHSKENKYLHLTKGVHIVVDHKKFPIQNALYFDTPFNDGRMMFAIPRGEKVYVGTTDTFYEKNPAEPEIKRADVTYILDAINQMFNIQALTIDDIESAWAGVRPLIHQAGKDPSEISRRDEIFHSTSGLYSIAGGKLTGYRKMAETIMDQVLKDLSENEGIPYLDCQTRTVSLSGGTDCGYPAYDQMIMKLTQQGVTHYNLDKQVAKEVVAHYGTNAKLVFDFLLEDNPSTLTDICFAKLRYALEYEMTLHPIDFLLRRTGLMLFDIAECRAIEAEVINYMASYYDWNDAQKEKIIAEVATEFERHTQFNY
ncbi:glycerol-3-phosphate dehydrogenase/oxidase [Vagococcus silagei]|nr:glycerol-3-phosphate dehydrogenase/oxidase [Vagococcus silagei]